MKKILFLSLALLSGASAFADDFSLYYDAEESNIKLESVNDLQKITFEDGNMVITRKDGATSSVKLTSIKRLFFSTDEAVNIEAPKTAEIQNGEIYDLTGRRVSAAHNALPKGIYIVNGKKVAIDK